MSEMNLRPKEGTPPPLASSVTDLSQSVSSTLPPTLTPSVPKTRRRRPFKSNLVAQKLRFKTVDYNPVPILSTMTSDPRFLKTWRVKPIKKGSDRVLSEIVVKVGDHQSVKPFFNVFIHGTGSSRIVIMKELEPDIIDLTLDSNSSPPFLSPMPPILSPTLPTPSPTTPVLSPMTEALPLEETIQLEEAIGSEVVIISEETSEPIKRQFKRSKNSLLQVMDTNID